ncbi:MAG: hypothetical protein KF890_15275 [Nitrospira sp.]|nr:hypothetical protein [Nitrospira sp.]
MKHEEVLKLNLKSWPLPDDYLIELGRVAALWATLETFLNMCIGKLAGFNDINDAKPFILITHSSFPQRLDMLAALCEQLADKFSNLKHYKTVVSQLRDAQKLRNDFMHYGMSVNPESGQVQMAIGSARGTVKVSIKSIGLQDIRRASIAIHEAELALYKLVLKREVPPKWSK